MKKRRRNITIIKNEIDYDKLAETIVKANSTTKTSSEEESVEKLTIGDFFKLVYYIIVNKKQSNGTMTSGLLGSLIALVFNLLALLGLIACAFDIFGLVNIIKDCVWSVESISNNISTIILMIAFLIIVALFSLVFRGAANEMADEKDRNYVVAVFSGIVSFAALVVALIALLKGVG